MYGAYPNQNDLEIINSVQTFKSENGDIPKIIHYCWFGGNPLPESALKCIESWKKHFPDFEVLEWNETNFNVEEIPYIKEAYERKKYAFVSDYARFAVLYLYGGLYFDTDVEVIKDFTPILEKGPFMGCEKEIRATDNTLSVAPGLGLGVNPGLGLGVNPGLGLYKELTESYLGEHFINDDGSNNIKTIVDRTTEILCKYGLKNTNEIQTVAGITIYPKEYFCPKIMDSDEMVLTDNTYSIHHYDATWAEELDKKSGKRAYKLKKIFGNRLGSAINTVIYGYEKYGIVGSIKRWKNGK